MGAADIATETYLFACVVIALRIARPAQTRYTLFTCQYLFVGKAMWREISIGLCASLLSTISLAQTVAAPDEITPRILLERSKGKLGPQVETRKLAQSALLLIKSFEKLELRPYNDPNYCTIGYGHLIVRHKCTDVELAMYRDHYSEADADNQLTTDVRFAMSAVATLAPASISDDQFGALTSFVFNVGAENFRKSRMLRLIKAGELDAAADEFPRWVISAGKPMEGLRHRRSCEAMLFRSELKMKAGAFDRESCKSFGLAPPDAMLIDIDLGEI